MSTYQVLMRFQYTDKDGDLADKCDKVFVDAGDKDEAVQRALNMFMCDYKIGCWMLAGNVTLVDDDECTIEKNRWYAVDWTHA
jgi:hypothetical protein